MHTGMRCVGCDIAVVGLRTCPGCGAALDLQDMPGPQLPQRWELTAPESYLLRYVDCGATNAGAFKLALIELLQREALVLDGALIRRRWGPGSRSVWLLSDGPRLPSVDEPALVPVLRLYTRLRERRPEVEGVLVTDLVKAGARGRAGFRDYLSGAVASSLQGRGHLSAARERTPAGDQAEQRLDEWLQIGKHTFPRWSHHASWRRAYLQGAGAAVLLLGSSHPAFMQIAGISTPTDQVYAVARGPENGEGILDAVDASFIASGVGFGELGFGDGGG